MSRISLLFVSLPVFSSWLLLITQADAREPWEDDQKYYSGPVVLTAPQGYRTYPAPLAGTAPTGSVEGLSKIEVTGFVETGGLRFYLTEASQQAFFKSGEERVWIEAGGTEEFPALPRLLKRGFGEDPNSGEEVMIEAYEEIVTLQPESRWPAPVTRADKFFPAALLAVGEDTEGRTTVDLQLFMNTDALSGGYPFIRPSYNEITGGTTGALVRLYSRPGTTNVRLLIEGRSPVLSLMQPGLVFLAGFTDGSLTRLSLGGDAWTESAPISRLAAPVFKNEGKLAFGFTATEFVSPAGGIPIRISPDRLAGADYTQYNLIAQMGAPFDEYSVPEFQGNWTLHIERDLTTTLLAPLYDGRGAPGMLELEGLSLDPAPPAPNVDNISEEQFAAFRSFQTAKTDPGIFGEGWKSILEHKLGDIPVSQRVPETDGY